MASPADERYQRAQAIVHEVLEHPDDERDGLIDAACAGDVDLRREVEWLIASTEITGSDDAFAGVGELADAWLADAHIEAAAPRQYHLLKRIGEGGMGQVWLAERDDGEVRQRVALKMLRSVGSRGDAELARFQAEGRILASLSHPNIAHLIEAGRGADGEPFLAMEFVDGVRIDAWCNTHAPLLRARIELFLKVCAAVEYAHAHLVIHRDLKPVNILVTAGGEPKLLDFGIARLLEQDVDAMRTATALRTMTLAYASPEQIEGRALGTATDIYSLGVVLYELVTGVRPFDHLDTEHARSNAIVSGAITPPSRQARAAATNADGTRRALPAAGRRNPADIDAIVLKALRREAAQRYASVGEFADDLRRYLAALPVLARRGQWWYRTQRFAWRNRWPLAAAAILIAVASGFTWRTVLAEREARVQAATSDRVAEFLVSVFAASDSNVNLGLHQDLTAREVLDAGAARIDKELGDQPRIRAQLLEAVANAYRHMNDNNKAATLMREAAKLNLSPAVTQPLAAARCLEALANLLANGEFPAGEAERAARESLALAQRLTPTDSQEIANAWMVLSLAQNRAGNYAAAQASAEKTFAMNFAKRDERDTRLTAAYNNLCIILANRGELAAARSDCENGISVHDGTGEPRSMGRAMTTSRYGQVLARLFEPHAAAQATDHAIELARAIQGDHGRFPAVFRLRKAAILDDAGRYDEADALLQSVRAVQEQLNGKDSGEYANVLLEIARRHNLLGEYEKAQPLLREITEVAHARYGADDPRTLTAATELAFATLGAGNADAPTHAALDAADAAWARKDDAGPLMPPATWFALAKWFAMNGDAAHAAAQLDRIDALGAKTEVWLRVRAFALRAALAHDDAATALRNLDKAWSLLRDSAGPEHPQAARRALAYARALRDAGRVAEATTIEAQARPIFDRAFPADSAFRRETRSTP